MIVKLKIYWKLGLINIASIIIYRLALKAGVLKKLTPAMPPVSGVFYSPTDLKITSLESVDTKAFGWMNYSKTEIPIWNRSIVSDQTAKVQHQHWSEISDFNLNVGDIKTVWELSRFDWLFHFAIDYLKTNDASKLETLNAWLTDWSQNNPANLGINWKCGQESSIRVMHLCLVALILNQEKSLSPAFIKMLEQHLERIAPTIMYAMAQDNNHGTSEAVALYIGGLLLEHNSDHKSAKRWKNRGRYWIQNRLQKLIMDDGSFSQYSVNYHRVMLDSICIAELFRIKFSENEFSNKAIKKVKLSIEWLAIFTNKNNGDAPNLGANDGAKLMPLTATDYRDYRPTVQLATTLFYGMRRYKKTDTYDQILDVLKLEPKKTVAKNNDNRIFQSGGYVVLRNSNTSVFMRLPNFKFRPSQCDLFHVDLWVNNQNLLRDAGSYSYNCEPEWQNYFPSTGAHNVIQFDDKQQMPKLSRFLYGNWLELKSISTIVSANDVTQVNATYKLDGNIQHSREISLATQQFNVTDTISGFSTKAILRWRLKTDDYLIKDNQIIGTNMSISVQADAPIKRIEIVKGYESRYYMQKLEIPVLEIELHENAKIETNIRWYT